MFGRTDFKRALFSHTHEVLGRIQGKTLEAMMEEDEFEDDEQEEDDTDE